MSEWIISSSVLIVLVLAIRYFLRNRLAMRGRYALWLVVAVRLLVPVSFAESAFSVLNLFSALDSGGEQGAEQTLSTDSAAAEGQLWKDISTGASGNLTDAGRQDADGLERKDLVQADSGESVQWNAPFDGAGSNVPAVKAEPGEAPSAGVSDSSSDSREEADLVSGPGVWAVASGIGQKMGRGFGLRCLWIFGTAVSACVVFLSNRKYRKRVYISRRRYKGGRESRLPVYVSAVIDTPCMFGLFRPAVYLSTEAARNEKALHYVLCHENTHYRHRDNVWVVVRVACVCLHWYNPLVWIAAALSEQDGELACDERTMELLGEEERIRYGRALLDFSAKGGVLQGGWKLSTAMSSGKKQLKERLLLVVGEPRRHAGAMALVMLLAALCSAVTFTGRVSGQESGAGIDGNGIGQGVSVGAEAEDGAGGRPDSAGSGEADAPGLSGEEAPTQTTAIVPVDLNDGRTYTLKIGGETVPGSGEYRIDRIELNRIQDRTEETLQTIRPEEVRVLYTRSRQDIRNGDGKAWSYAPEKEPLFAKVLCTETDLPLGEAEGFRADENGQIWANASDGGIVVADLNFDGYQDFYLQAGTGGANTLYYCYLWDSQSGRFEPGYMIPNLEVDAEAQLLKSATEDGNARQSVKYYSFDAENVLHMVRYTEVNQAPDALFPVLDLTYCETSYSLPAVDEWDYGTLYGGALTERFIAGARQALAELYEWSGTKIDTACFTVTSYGDFIFGNTPADVKASRTYFDRSYGESAGFEEVIEEIRVVTERVVWYSPVTQWNVPENLDQMTDAQVAEWYFGQTILSKGEVIDRIEKESEDGYYLITESGKYYIAYVDSATREVYSLLGPYDGRPVH